MTPIGHSLIGLSFAAFVVPVNGKASILNWRSFGIACAFVALANLPDWPLPNWGHDRYDISHSVFVNVGLIGLVVVLAKVFAKGSWFCRNRFLVLAAMAWLSHLLLDTFYNHGQGIGLFWPVSKQRLSLAMPWFDNWDLSQPVSSAHNLSVFGIEFLAYFPILLGALFISFRLRRQRPLR